MRYLFLAVIGSLFLLSCDSNRVYETDIDFSDRTWKISDTTLFDFHISDIESKYNVYYNVRNTLDYPNARLFIKYSLTDSLGKQLAGELVAQDLFDQKTGKPNGNSGLGDIYDHRYPLLQNFSFLQRGKYSVRLQQYMRADTLKGILAVGIRVERAGKN